MVYVLIICCCLRCMSSITDLSAGGFGGDGFGGGDFGGGGFF